MVKLSIIIPVYNESKTVSTIIEKVKSVDLGEIKKEIIAIDDFSTDGTKSILEKVDGIKVLRHDKNRGKGSAIRTGIEHATGDVIIIQDADLEYDPEEFPVVLKPILEDSAEVVYGSRFLQKTNHKPRYLVNYLGLKFLAFLVSALYGQKVTDVETCYKAFKSDVIKGINLKAERFDFEPEVTAKLIKKGHSIVEVPVSYRGRSYEDGKKIRWRDGINAIYCLVKYRFFD